MNNELISQGRKAANTVNIRMVGPPSAKTEVANVINELCDALESALQQPSAPADREQFEAWLRSECFQEPPKHCRDLAWSAWQAARLSQESAPAEWEDVDAALDSGNPSMLISAIKALRARLQGQQWLEIPEFLRRDDGTQGQQGEAEPVPSVAVKRICDHCNKEFDLPMRRAGNAIPDILCNFCDCPHCNERNDIWIQIKPVNTKPAPTIPDRDAIGQAVSDFFAPLDNGDGTLAFDHCDSNDIDRLVGVMLYVLDAGTTIPEGMVPVADLANKADEALSLFMQSKPVGGLAALRELHGELAYQVARQATAAPDSGGDNG